MWNHFPPPASERACVDARVQERRQGTQDRSVTPAHRTVRKDRLTALYVKIDDEIGDTRWLGRPPQLTDSELVCLAVAQAMLGFASESR